MNSTSTSRVCAFCGQQGDQNTRFAAGLGVLIDEECVAYFAHAMNEVPTGSPVRDPSGRLAVMRRRDVADLSDAELLEALPQIASTAGQVNQFLGEWVELIRARKMSWTTIGNAMKISRQAAWERFTRTSNTEKKPGFR